MNGFRPTPGSVKSAVRVFEIIEHLDDVRGGLALSQIAKNLDYPISSTAQLLKCMCEIGVVCRDRSTRRYFTTPKLALLGSANTTLQWTKGSIHEVMCRMAESTGENIALGMRLGLSVNFICSIHASKAGRPHAPAGLTVPLTTSAFGRLILSQMGEPERQMLIRRLNAELEPRQQTGNLAEELETIRQRGYAVTRSCEFEGWGMVAVMLPPAEQAIGLGIGAPVEVIEQNECEFASVLLGALDQLKDPPVHWKQTLAPLG